MASSKGEKGGTSSSASTATRGNAGSKNGLSQGVSGGLPIKTPFKDAIGKSKAGK